MADTSDDAAKLDREREAQDQRLGDVQAKLAEMESDKAESRAASILAGLGFSPERQQFPTKTFSGGWRMRLALARALFCEPDLLLLDEPHAGLDATGREVVAEALTTAPAEGRTVVMVSHELDVARPLATREVRIDGGRAEELPTPPVRRVAAGTLARTSSTRRALVVNGSRPRSRTTASAMRRAKRSSPYSRSTRARSPAG